MAVLNRTEDASVQRQVMSVNAGATATGVTGIIGVVPSSCVVEGGVACAFGLSGAPNVGIWVNRFIVGTGFTTFVLATGTSNVLSAVGTSGTVNNLLFGTTTLLLPLDVLMYQTGVANAAVTGLSVNIIVRPLQDVVTRLGVI